MAAKYCEKYCRTWKKWSGWKPDQPDQWRRPCRLITFFTQQKCSIWLNWSKHYWWWWLLEFCWDSYLLPYTVDSWRGCHCEHFAKPPLPTHPLDLHSYNCLEPNAKARIEGVKWQMTTFDLLFGLKLCGQVLKMTNNSSKTLQKSSLSAAQTQAHCFSDCHYFVEDENRCST